MALQIYTADNVVGAALNKKRELDIAEANSRAMSNYYAALAAKAAAQPAVPKQPVSTQEEQEAARIRKYSDIPVELAHSLGMGRHTTYAQLNAMLPALEGGNKVQAGVTINEEARYTLNSAIEEAEFKRRALEAVEVPQNVASQFGYRTSRMDMRTLQAISAGVDIFTKLEKQTADLAAVAVTNATLNGPKQGEMQSGTPGSRPATIPKTPAQRQSEAAQILPGAVSGQADGTRTFWTNPAGVSMVTDYASGRTIPRSELVNGNFPPEPKSLTGRPAGAAGAGGVGKAKLGGGVGTAKLGGGTVGPINPVTTNAVADLSGYIPISGSLLGQGPSTSNINSIYLSR